MDRRPQRPAMLLFGGQRGSWKKTASLSGALGKSKDVVMVWNRGKESIFYLEKRDMDTSFERIGR